MADKADVDREGMGGVYLGPADRRIEAEFTTFLAEARPDAMAAAFTSQADGPRILREVFFAGAFSTLTMIMADMMKGSGHSPAMVRRRLLALHAEAQEFMLKLFPDMADGPGTPRFPGP